MFNRYSMKEQIVLITGAASGIGRETARAFADEGATVLLADLNLTEAELLKAELEAKGTTAYAVSVDVGDPESIGAMFEWIGEKFERLHACVTCAGVINKTKLLEMGPAEWNRVLSINLTGTFLCIQGAYRLMMPYRSGSIVAIASDTAKRGGGRIGTSAYGASKGGVLAMVKSVAREMAGCGVRINTICPGPADTEMHTGLNDNLREQVAGSIPLGRFAQPREIANSIVFLCSDVASYIYGESLNVDGGVLME